MAPKSAISAAEIRTRPTVSPRNSNASAMPTTGLRKLIAVASDSRMKAAAANMKLTPSQPQSTRTPCAGQAGRVNCGRRIRAAVAKVSSAKTNRPG